MSTAAELQRRYPDSPEIALLEPRLPALRPQPPATGMTPAPIPATMLLQLGVFETRANALRLRDKVPGTLGTARIDEVQRGSQRLFRVSLGPFDTICHGAPFEEDYYIFGEFDPAEAFSYIQTPVCFLGHTHFPFVYTEKDGNVEGTFLEGNANEVKLEKGVRYLINPGSVGQPRDRNPRAAFAVYDSEARTVKFSRVDYDIEEAKRKIIDERLPPALAERLSLGI